MTISTELVPSMPKEYIVRLVFDKNHKSVAAIKNIGGVQQAVGSALREAVGTGAIRREHLVGLLGG